MASIATLCGLLAACLLTDAPGLQLPSSAAASPASSAQRRVLIIAHRGASSRAPENTIPAFELAVRAGADLVELDYYHSADGVPVVFHDKELDRTTNATKVFGAKKIRTTSKTFADLRRLDAGTWFDRRFAGTKIPTLAEGLAAIQAGSTTLIERKHGDAATCIELLRRKKLLTKVVVQSFDWEYLTDCHRLAPELRLTALGSKELTAKKLDQIVACGAGTVAWNYKDLRPADINAIHDRGLKAWIYTVNATRDAQPFVDAGIDAIITDKPAEFLKFVRGFQDN